MTQRIAVRIKLAQPMRAAGNRVPPVQVAPNGDRQARTRPAARLRRDLQDLPGERHGIVASHHALLFVTENGVEIDGAQRHEGACRLLADGVDIRIIQLMLGHASIQQTQRYLNVTDEELRRGLEVSWNNKGRPLRLASGG